MKTRLFGIILAVAATVSLWWVLWQRPVSQTPRADTVVKEQSEPFGSQIPISPSGDIAQADAGGGAAPAILPGPVQEKTKPTALAARAELPAGPEAVTGGADLTPSALLENVRSVFRQYSQRFGANPVGDNAEITASLNGQNPRRVVFINAEDGLRVNDKGELVDNWGTPFFFHQLSRLEMEIHSAGPDRRMWSADDLVLK